MWYDRSVVVNEAIVSRLIEFSTPSAYSVSRRLFPDSPRPINDSFMAQAGLYLITLEEKQNKINWLPDWLSRGQRENLDLTEIIKFYIDQCLTYFADSEPHRVILLRSHAIKRLVKLDIIASAASRDLGAKLHALSRFHLPEMSWDQVLASPEKQLLGIIEARSRAALNQFVTDNTGPDRKFRIELAKIQLRYYWRTELELLDKLPDYRKILAERNLANCG